LANQDSTTGKVQEPAFKYIRSADVKTAFTKSELQTEEDVNEYIDKLKLAMLEKVRDNKRITL
jgi:maltooligosyltrehalose synthase